MNIYDVSQMAGVSIATVSRVLNGSPNVSEKTKEKVIRVMEEMGYTPNVFARGLGLNTMKTIGIMCPDSSDPYMANAVYYLEQGLRSHGYDSILCCTGYSLENKKKSLSLLLSKRVDALILVGSKFVELKAKDNEYLKTAAGEVPLMLVNGCLKGKNIYCTVCDDRSAIHLAVKRLIADGRKDILYLHTSDAYSGASKLKGYKDALTAAGLPVRDGYIRQCPKDISAARELISRLRDEGLSFDAVVVSDDELAVGAVKYAHAAGISIRMSSPSSATTTRSCRGAPTRELSSIDNKVEAMCTTTVNTLMGVFGGINVPAKTIIAADLILRETTNFI